MGQARQPARLRRLSILILKKKSDCEGCKDDVLLYLDRINSEVQLPHQRPPALV